MKRASAVASGARIEGGTSGRKSRRRRKRMTLSDVDGGSQRLRFRDDALDDGARSPCRDARVSLSGVFGFSRPSAVCPRCYHTVWIGEDDARRPRRPRRLRDEPPSSHPRHGHVPRRRRNPPLPLDYRTKKPQASTARPVLTLLPLRRQVLQLKNYRKITLQRFVVRILIM